MWACFSDKDAYFTRNFISEVRQNQGIFKPSPFPFFIIFLNWQKILIILNFMSKSF